VDDLIVDAVYEALQDAKLEMKDIQAVWAGTANSGVNAGSVSAPLQLQYVPVTRVENACATGIEVIRNAAHALVAKVYDLVLAVGFEKLKDLGYPGLHRVSSQISFTRSTRQEERGRAAMPWPPPGIFSGMGSLRRRGNGRWRRSRLKAITVALAIQRPICGASLQWRMSSTPP